MPSATQLQLFSSAAPRCDPGSPPREVSERLLEAFHQARLAAGAHPRSVGREISQLRSLARDAELRGNPSTFEALASDMALVARLLLDPATPIARATGRARLEPVMDFGDRA